MRNTPIEGSLHGDHDVDWYRVPHGSGQRLTRSAWRQTKARTPRPRPGLTGIYNSDGEFAQT